MRNIRLVSAAALAACATLVAGAQSPQQPPPSQQSDAHSMIFAICSAGPMGKPSIAGKAV